MTAIVAAALDVLLFTNLLEEDALAGRTMFGASPAVVVGLGMVAAPILIVRRRWPVTVCLVLVVYSAVLTVTIGSRPLVVLLVALYTAASYSPLGPAVACLLATLAAHAITLRYELSSVTGSWESVIALATLFILLDLAAWGAGRWAEHTRARTRQLVESRAAMAAKAVNDERLRIARELHDIVAHAVTVMVLNAAGAKKLTLSEPDLAIEAMQSVQDVGKQAMAELRRLLEVLRTVSPAELPEDPANRLSTLDTLIAQVRSTGVQVQTCTTGRPGRLDPSVDLTAYRVIQESLTNVTRHAGPGAAVNVNLMWTSDLLTVEIVDDGAGMPLPVVHELSSGYGFAGLRERVKLIGGTIESGHGTDIGYRVLASLPADTS